MLEAICFSKCVSHMMKLLSNFACHLNFRPYAKVGCTLPATLLFDYPTVAAAAAYIATLVGPMAAAPAEVSAVSAPHASGGSGSSGRAAVVSTGGGNASGGAVGSGARVDSVGAVPAGHTLVHVSVHPEPFVSLD